MGDIIKFGAPAGGFDLDADPDGMDREELREFLDAVRAELDRMDEGEPADLESEAYEAWADRHEELEDLADELQDRLDDWC